MKSGIWRKIGGKTYVSFLQKADSMLLRAPERSLMLPKSVRFLKEKLSAKSLRVLSKLKAPS